MHLAIRRGAGRALQEIEFLLKAGAEVNTRNIRGEVYNNTSMLYCTILYSVLCAVIYIVVLKIVPNASAEVNTQHT
jgi:hypothetical protein